VSPSDPAFLLLRSSGDAPEQTVLNAARAGDLDARGLALRMRGEGLLVAAQGSAERLSRMGEALAGAGGPWALVTASQARGLPAVEVAGGIAAMGGAIALRVHGRPAGPPPGVPLLMIFGDLGRQDSGGASSPRPGDSLTQRTLRAVFPVVDIVWNGGRRRVALKQMTFHGLPGAAHSVAENLLLLLQRLAAQSGGAVLDAGFYGQDVLIEPLRGAQEPIEGADRERLALFERYAAAASLAFASGLYPEAAPGELLAPELPAAAPGEKVPPITTAAGVLRPSASPVPWIRKPRDFGIGSKFRLRDLLPFTPIAFFVLFHACIRISPRTEGRGASVVAGTVMTAAGLGLILFGLRALTRRERLRAVPTSKIRSLPMGPAEVAGRLVPTATFKAPYSRTPCVWYRFEVEEIGGDEERRQAGWRVIQRGGSGEVPFRVKDGTGTVLVQPAGARIETEPRTIRLDDKTRAREWVLTEGEYVYVAGEAHRRSAAEGVSGGADVDDVFIGAGTDGFLSISPRSHDAQERRLALQALFSFAGGVVSLVLAVLLFAS
jgi:hypothetical protein